MLGIIKKIYIRLSTGLVNVSYHRKCVCWAIRNVSFNLMNTWI